MANMDTEETVDPIFIFYISKLGNVKKGNRNGTLTVASCCLLFA